MSNEYRVNPGNFQNEQRGNYGKMQNEPLVNNTKLQIEPRGNSEKLQDEARANHEEFSEMEGRGGLKSFDKIHLTACPPILTQNSECKQKSGTSSETREESLLPSNEQIVAQIRAGIEDIDNMLLLWNQNHRFVKMTAVKFTGRAELDDLMQEGYIALYEAVRHYDAEQGVPFINYAAFWIRQGMQRYIANCGCPVRIPVHTTEWIHKYKKMVSEYRKYYGREPSDKALCALLRINQEKLSAIKESIRMGQIRSLNESLGDEDGELTVGDSVSSGEDMEEDAVQRMDYECLKEHLWEAVDSLNERQAAIIRYRFIENKTLKEIGEMDGVTIQAVRTQQDKAMRELRKPSRCQKFRGYYEEYIVAASTHHVGLESFRQSWWSEVERDVIGYGNV